MRLDERNWIYGAGLTADWKEVMKARVRSSLAKLEAVAAEFARKAPRRARKSLYLQGMKGFLKRGGDARTRLVAHPSFDYWLYLWDKHFSVPSSEENWDLQFGLFQAFPALLALREGGRREFDLLLDPDAHLHLYGGPSFLEFPKGAALKPVRLSLQDGTAELKGPEGLRVRVPRKLLAEPGAPSRRFGPVTLRRHPAVLPTMDAQWCGLLMVQCVTVHELAHPGPKEAAEFVRVLKTALSHIGERDPALYAEMTDMTAALVPLVNTMSYGSVSSSYVNLRGAICLSHAEDPLLQAETLIHEFCHQKINQLLLVEPLVLPGQGGQAFYSPWRPDPRRLRGLILGAHAFLNVANYLLKSLSREPYPLREKVAVMTNVARRLFEVDAALRIVCGYAALTEFGRRFALGMSQELALLFHGVQWFPPVLMNEAWRACQAHRKEHALPWTGIHRAKAFAPKVRPVPFGNPVRPRKRAS